MVRNILLGMGLATVLGVGIADGDLLGAVVANLVYLVVLALYCLSTLVTGDAANDGAAVDAMGAVRNFVVLVGASVLAPVVGAEYVGALIALAIVAALFNGKVNASVSGSAGGSCG